MTAPTKRTTPHADPPRTTGRLRRGTVTLLLVAVTVFAVSSFIFGATVEAQESFKPKLSINIPTISFSSVQVQNSSTEAGISGYIDVPWIAEYMKGIYGYAVGIAGLLAGVMIVIGGFYYLTAGGDATRIQKGKQRIADAIIGLFLVFGAYMLLNTISPQLTSFDALHIKRLKANPYEMVSQALGSTTVETGTSSGSESSGETSSAGPPVSTFPDCPVADLPAAPARNALPPNGPRGIAFRDGIRALPNLPTDMRARIAAVAEAVVRCHVHLGSCGATAGSIWTIAGIGSANLGVQTHESNGTTQWGSNPRSHEIPTSISWQTFFVACGAECAGTDTVHSHCGDGCDLVPATDGNPRNRDGSIRMVWKATRNCVAPGAAAKQRVREMIEANPGMAGWPDSWTNNLEIGDIINIYNGNASCGSAHAQVFLGWASEGRARLANGQWGGPQWFSTECLKRSCGNFSIVTRIYKPRMLAH